MSQNIQAIYTNGTLIPLTPLDLREQELVRLTVSPLRDDPEDQPSTDQDLTYQPIPPRSSTEVLAHSIRRGRGTPMSYDDLTLDSNDID